VHQKNYKAPLAYMTRAEREGFLIKHILSAVGKALNNPLLAVQNKMKKLVLWYTNLPADVVVNPTDRVWEVSYKKIKARVDFEDREAAKKRFGSPLPPPAPSQSPPPPPLLSIAGKRQGQSRDTQVDDDAPAAKKMEIEVVLGDFVFCACGVRHFKTDGDMCVSCKAPMASGSSAAETTPMRTDSSIKKAKKGSTGFVLPPKAMRIQTLRNLNKSFSKFPLGVFNMDPAAEARYTATGKVRCVWGAGGEGGGVVRARVCAWASNSAHARPAGLPVHVYLPI
jgi:hypothetical protein